MTYSKTPKEPTGCYGVLCEKHHNCQKYAAVDGAKGNQRFIGTCLEDGVRVKFVPIVREVAEV